MQNVSTLTNETYHTFPLVPFVKQVQRNKNNLKKEIK